MKNRIQGPRHFLDIENLSREELETVLMQAMEIRRQIETGLISAPQPLRRKEVAYVSVKESVRTKAAIGQAARYLGGGSRDFAKDSLFDEKEKPREPLGDIAACLEAQGYPITFARLKHHNGLEEMTAGRTRMSVVNALTDDSHPLQALADAEALMLERPYVRNHKVVFSGDGNNVCTSLGDVSAKLGWQFVHTGPEKLQVKPERWARMKRMAEENEGSVSFTTEIERAMEGATFVYTDKFRSMGQDAEQTELRERLLPAYQVNPYVMEFADPQAVFGHCLPAERGAEVTSEVIDGPQSIVKRIAGCRMDTTAAIMQFLLKEPPLWAKIEDWFSRVAIGSARRPQGMLTGQTGRVEAAIIRAEAGAYTES